MSTYFVGFEFAPVDGWENILPTPKAPSNWKDPDKIDDYVGRKLEELRDGKAGTEPLSGSVSRVCVLQKHGKKMHTELDAGGPHVGSEFADWVYENSKQPTAPLLNATLIGLKIHRAVRLAALDLIGRDGSLHAHFRWALELDSGYRYNYMPGYIDPLSKLFGSSDTDLQGACRRLGIDEVDPNDAGELAMVAYQMGCLLGLD